MAFSLHSPSGPRCLGLHSRTPVPQEYFGFISPSHVLFGALGAQVGALGLPREKNRLFLKLKLLSCLPPRRFISSLAEAPGASLERLPVLSELQPAAQGDPEVGKPSQQFGSLWIGDAGEFLWQIPGRHRNPIGPGGSAGRFQLSDTAEGRAQRCIRRVPPHPAPGGAGRCGSEPPSPGTRWDTGHKGTSCSELREGTRILL